MKALRRMMHRIRGLFSGRGPEMEMAEEFTEHIRMQTEDNIRAGMDPETAEREARIKFGNVLATTEEWRERRGIPFLETLWRDVLYALRVLGQKKGWTVVAVLSIGLGIGANTALFSFIHALFLDELRVPASGELVAFRWVGSNTVSGSTYNYGAVRGPEGERAGATFTLEAYEAFQAENEALSEVFASASGGVLNLIVDGVADVASSEFVSGNYFRGLGVTPAAGRTLTPQDDTPDADLAVVISYEYRTQPLRARSGHCRTRRIAERNERDNSGCRPAGPR